MPLIRLIRHLLAAPVYILAMALSLVSRAASADLFRIAWRINLDPRTGHSALAKLLTARGSDAARAEATRMLAISPSSELAAVAGMMALGADDIDSALLYLDQAKALGLDPIGLVELLEYRLAEARAHTPGQLYELAADLAQRRDVSPAVTRMALESLMWREMLLGRCDEASGRAERLLSVSENPQARIVRWALESRDGQHDRAQSSLAAAKMPDPQRLFYQYLGSWSVGRRDEAEDILAALREADPQAASHAERVLAGGVESR